MNVSRETIIDVDIKLGPIQLTLERLVREHDFSLTELEQKTKRVMVVMENIWWSRDFQLRRLK